MYEPWPLAYKYSCLLELWPVDVMMQDRAQLAVQNIFKNISDSELCTVSRLNINWSAYQQTRVFVGQWPRFIQQGTYNNATLHHKGDEPLHPYIKPFGARFDPNELPYFKYKKALEEAKELSANIAGAAAAAAYAAQKVY